jgi:hypothetical protein
MSEEFCDMRTKELQNGRLAMIAVAAFIGQVRSVRIRDIVRASVKVRVRVRAKP